MRMVGWCASPRYEEKTENLAFSFRDHLTHGLVKATEERSQEWKRVCVGDVVA